MPTQDHPLLEKLRSLQANRATGVLRLVKEGKQISVAFRDGLIEGASTDIAGLQLGRVLSGAGFVDATAVGRLLQESRRRSMPIGKAAVSRKLLDEAQLEENVRRQVVQVVAHALKEDFEEESFGDPAPAPYMPARIDLSRILLEMARQDVKPYVVDSGRAIALNNGADLSHLPWYPQELSVLGELKKPQTVKNLAAATGIEPSRLSRILHVLDSLKLIRTADEPHPAPAPPADGFAFDHLTPEISRAGLSEKLESIHREGSFISEQFKTLKVRIGEVKVLAVSSPQTEDGKTLVAANLAASFSKDPDRRVIVVDCDLRNPTLHRLLGIPVEPGLLGYLQGERLQPHCYMRRFENLYIMTAGGLAPNPIELLTHTRMRALIDCLKADFDTIILDAPPFAPISDASILTTMADGLILVVRCGKTSYGNIEKAHRVLDRNKLLGVVLNDVKPMLFNTQYDYRYYHYKHRAHYPYKGPAPTKKQKTYLDS